MAAPRSAPPHIETEQPMAMAPAPRNVWLTRSARAFGLLTMCTALVFLGLRLRSELHTLLGSTAGEALLSRAGGSLLAALVPKVLLAFLACWFSFALSVVNWWNLLPSNRRIGLLPLAAVFGYTLITQYLPGGVFQYLFGMTVAARLGLPKLVTVQLFLRDSLIAIATAMGLIALAGFGPARSLLSHAVLTFGQRWWPAFALACAVMVLASVLFARLEPFTRLRNAARSVLGLAPRALLVAIALHVLHFFAQGFAALQLAELWSPALDPTRLPSWFAMTSGFALAWLVGLLVPGAPSGLGVREVLLSTMFAPALGEARAIATFIALRSVTCACELLFFAPAPWLARRYGVALNQAEIPA